MNKFFSTLALSAVFLCGAMQKESPSLDLGSAIKSIATYKSFVPECQERPLVFFVYAQLQEPTKTLPSGRSYLVRLCAQTGQFKVVGTIDTHFVSEEHEFGLSAQCDDYYFYVDNESAIGWMKKQ